MANVIKTLLTALIVGIAALFGFTLTPDTGVGLTLFTWLAGLGVKTQVGILVALVLLVVVPIAAPYTKWTGDDWTIKYKTGAVKIFMQLWNLLSGNFGRAANKDQGG